MLFFRGFLKFRFLFFGLVFLLLLYRFDVVRGWDDVAIASEIEKGLLSKRVILVRELIPNADVLCVLPPYVEPAAIGGFLSKKQQFYLENRINSIFGLGDHVWWLVSLNGVVGVEVYRMSGLARPDFRTGKCLPQNTSIIQFASKDGYIFFNFERME